MIVSISDATPALAQHARPARAAAGGRSSHVVLAGAGDLLGRSSRGTASAPPARARGDDVGRSSASSSRSQSRAGAVPNTLPAPLITAGMPAASSASRTSAALRCVRTSTATWPGRIALAPQHLAVVVADLDLGVGRQQRDDVGGEVLRDVLARAGAFDA